MAGTNKMYFRIEIKKRVGGADGATVFEAGEYTGQGAILNPADNGHARFQNLNSAVSKCLAMVRRFDSFDTDVVGLVYGKPIGADDPDTAITLAGDVAGVGGNYPNVTGDQIYARLDAVPHYLKQRISISNRPATNLLNLAAADDGADVVAPAGP